MKEKINIGMIGLGGRGVGLLSLAILRMKDVDVVAVCDVYEDRIEKVKSLCKSRRRVIPQGYTDYNELLSRKDLDAVIISCSWAKHTEIALKALEMGIPVGSEVGGAYSIDECWSLVDKYEETKTPFMILENCCYGEYELAVLNMVKQGIFGDVVAMEGGYKHDLREEISYGNVNRHYRLNEYLNRNCENYPTHEIGPIAKVLNINYGNRFTSLSSISSKSLGLKEYITNKAKKDERLNELVGKDFAQGDVVHTTITCENGELVHIMLDTTLPRPYSRGFTCHGTKALYQEDGNLFFFDNKPTHKLMEFSLSKFFNNGKRFAKKYRHPIWKWFKSNGVKGGHGGMDWLVLRAFFEAIKKGDKKMPLDVYDAATWMVITALSDESIKNGSKYVDFPDFTRGKYKERKVEDNGLFFI